MMFEKKKIQTPKSLMDPNEEQFSLKLSWRAAAARVQVQKCFDSQSHHVFKFK